MKFNVFPFRKTSGLRCFTDLHTAVIATVQTTVRNLFDNAGEDAIDYWNANSSRMRYRRALKYRNASGNPITFSTGLDILNSNVRFVVWFDNPNDIYNTQRTALQTAFPSQYGDNRNIPPNEFWVALPDGDFDQLCQRTPQGMQMAAGFLGQVISHL